MRPRCCFLYLTFFGINIKKLSAFSYQLAPAAQLADRWRLHSCLWHQHNKNSQLSAISDQLAAATQSG
jgi:hypothetical protein